MLSLQINYVVYSKDVLFETIPYSHYLLKPHILSTIILKKKLKSSFEVNDFIIKSQSLYPEVTFCQKPQSPL